MLTAVLYGLLASSGFFVGVLVGLLTAPPRRLVAAIMAFGGGVLVSALTFDLMEEARVEGVPAILGTWIGAFTYSPFWTTVFFAVGIGAILQVVFEVGRLIVRSQANAGEPAMTWTTFGGVAAGIAVMYATGLLVAA